jgi:hypothetical protein
LTEEINAKGEVEVMVGNAPEIGVAYLTKEIIDRSGMIHLIFWKKSNTTAFEANQAGFKLELL